MEKQTRNMRFSPETSLARKKTLLHLFRAEHEGVRIKQNKSSFNKISGWQLLLLSQNRCHGEEGGDYILWPFAQ
jgi:hypothetical protein